jgi:hypothetical protein
MGALTGSQNKRPGHNQNNNLFTAKTFLFNGDLDSHQKSFFGMACHSCHFHAPDAA